MAKRKSHRYPLNQEGTIWRRMEYTVEKGRVIRFVVQLEIKLGESDICPVRRYDCAHGFVHCDHFNLRGETFKERLEMDYHEALTYAQQEITQEWEIHCERFSRGGFG